MNSPVELFTSREARKAWPVATIAMVLGCALYLFLLPDSTFFQTLGTAALMLIGIAMYRESPIVTGLLLAIAVLWSLGAPAAIDGDAPPMWAVIAVVTILVTALVAGLIAPFLGGFLVVIGVFAFLAVTAYSASAEELDAAGHLLWSGSFT